VGQQTTFPPPEFAKSAPEITLAQSLLHQVWVNDVALLNISPILVILDTSHFDTSWLNACALLNTAREGATKKRKDQPTTNNKKGYRDKNTKTIIIKRVRIVIQ
jgi:hypothetical protein